MKIIRNGKKFELTRGEMYEAYCEKQRLCEWIEDIFDIFKVEPFSGDEERMSELREEYGDEWVVRVGNTALIIRE